MKKLSVLVLMLGLAGCATMDVDHSQKGWRLRTDKVDLFITENGGHMAPVNFCSDSPTRSSHTILAHGRMKD